MANPNIEKPQRWIAGKSKKIQVISRKMGSTVVEKPDFGESRWSLKIESR